MVSPCTASTSSEVNSEQASNPVACAAGTATTDNIRTNKMLERIVASY
jgi:4-aminobutyrate aminotransferase-like enzyme